MYKRSKVTTIIKNEVQLFAILECGKLLLQTPVVFFFCLALPSKARPGLAWADSLQGLGRIHWSSAGCNGGSSVVLCGEDVAARPCDFGTKSFEGFNENSRLDSWRNVS